MLNYEQKRVVVFLYYNVMLTILPREILYHDASASLRKRSQRIYRISHEWNVSSFLFEVINNNKKNYIIHNKP
jgi:hypothetical protein